MRHILDKNAKLLNNGDKLNFHGNHGKIIEMRKLLEENTKITKCRY